MLLSNLKELKNDMVNKDWTICSFIFRYKGIEYIVLVIRQIKHCLFRHIKIGLL